LNLRPLRPEPRAGVSPTVVEHARAALGHSTHRRRAALLLYFAAALLSAGYESDEELAFTVCSRLSRACRPGPVLRWGPTAFLRCVARCMGRPTVRERLLRVHGLVSVITTLTSPVCGVAACSMTCMALSPIPAHCAVVSWGQLDIKETPASGVPKEPPRCPPNPRTQDSAAMGAIGVVHLLI
jgi:hypothetical protein